jgi:hypothetical protein
LSAAEEIVMLRSTAINITALLIIGLLGSATLAATLTASSDVSGDEVAQVQFEPGTETPEPGPETPEPGPETFEAEPAAETGEPEPAAETGEAGAGFGAIRSEEARRFGECMREHGGDGQGNAACVEHKPGPAHETPGHPGRGPEARPEHAGPPEGAGKPEHAGQGKPEHAGPPEGVGKPEHAGGKPASASTED